MVRAIAMYSLIRPLLFSLDAEKAHHWTLELLRYMPQICFKKVQSRPVCAMGIDFPHPVGLAAGLDKNGNYLDALSKLGFSFIEVGTITPRPQSGNPLPRLFRLPQIAALINRMGFNNMGVDALINNLKHSKYQGILGINIGKNKDTPIAKAAEDYTFCLQKVYPYASYITINLSSPNTPDLRILQQAAFFSDFLTTICNTQKRLIDHYQRFVPLVIKISPDETDETVKQMAQVIVEKGIAGIIATNTTNARPSGVGALPYGGEQGGLSGKPLLQRATECLHIMKPIVGKEVTLIGVGGIDTQAAAQEKIQAGATLLQVYTGLIYQGPGLVSHLIDSFIE